MDPERERRLEELLLDGAETETVGPYGEDPGSRPTSGAKPEAAGWLERLGRRKLGAYRIVGLAGAGGMGQVYVGEDGRLGRRVAIKTLPPEMAEHPGWLARFEREARTLAALNHPNIVTIHSVEEDDGIRFLTMELVEGTTLGEAIPRDGLPLDDLLHLATSLSDALAAAHERGVVHRDLKPANVMITGDRRVKILDFGIAKVPSSQGPGSQRQALSWEGMLIGTVAYMAPEQLLGEPVDARSDVFSLGVVLYQMATGRHPFPARSVAQRTAAILHHEPLPLDSVRPGLPAELPRIVTRCLEKEPGRRYRSAAELRDELAELQQARLAAKVLESRTDLHPGAGGVAGTPPPRRRSRSAVAVVVAAVVVAVSVPFAVTRLRTPPATEVAAAPTAAERSSRTPLAVLPFRNLTGDPDLDWLATGIAELVVTDLSQSPGLEVLGAAEVRRILGGEGEVDVADPLPPELVRKMVEEGEVTAVVRGSYLRLGDLLRITYTLDDPRSGEVVHTAAFDGEGEESLFGLVDRLSGAVRERLGAAQPELGPATVEAATTSSVAAWQAYTEAGKLYLEEAKPEAAIAVAEGALRIDPDFALAHVMLAKIHQTLGRNAEAQRYSRSAFELAERLPLNTRFDVEGGYYGTHWSTTGRAIETYDLALKVYPHEDGWRNNLARRYAFFERYDEAIEEFRKLIDSGNTFWGNHSGAANAHAALGDFERGHRLLADLAAERPDHWLLQYALAWHLTEWGKLGEAREAFNRVAELRPDTFHLPYGRWRLETLAEEWPRAGDEARRLLAFDESFPRWRGYVSLARGAVYRGRSKEALAWLDLAADAATGADRALARCFEAELLLARGENERALAEARQAREEGAAEWPELRAIYLAALAEEALGRPDTADSLRETLRERWRRQPNAVEERQLHHLAGRLALARGDLETARSELERAAALLPAHGVEFSWHVFPDHVPVWTDLGAAELAADRPRAALDPLVRATESGAEHLEQPLAWLRAWYLRGVAHRRLGEEEAARRCFGKFLDLWGDGDLHREWVEDARSQLAAAAR